MRLYTCNCFGTWRRVTCSWQISPLPVGYPLSAWCHACPCLIHPSLAVWNSILYKFHTASDEPSVLPLQVVKQWREACERGWPSPLVLPSLSFHCKWSNSGGRPVNEADLVPQSFLLCFHCKWSNSGERPVNEANLVSQSFLLCASTASGQGGQREGGRCEKLVWKIGVKN